MSFPFAGIEIWANEHMTDRKQVKFPKSKKKRMRKKWAQNPKNWGQVPQQHFYTFENKIICHPTLVPVLRHALGVLAA